MSPFSRKKVYGDETIREVPAVALGILERRLTAQEIFQIQMA
jgi:hypothetical protein